MSLAYDVVSQPPDTQLTPAVYHYPVLHASYFYLIGQALWVYPDLPGKTSLSLSLQWKNIPPGWSLINSFGSSESQQRVTTTLDQFRAGTFLAGDYRVKKIVLNEQPIYAVTRASWGFADDDFHNLVEKIVKVQRDFWQTYDFPYSMVALLPTDELSGSVGGERRTNSLSLYLPNELTNLSKHKSLIAHELFHTWNPERLGGFDDERLYWFSEGITDYYAPLLLLRAGLMSLDEYVDGYNSRIKEYYCSPVRALTAEEMVKKRRTSYEVERLFYERGYLLAYHWDITIRSKSDGRHSLDDVMRSLLKSAEASRAKLTHLRIANALRPFLAERGIRDIEKYINRGELIPVHNPFGACAVVESFEYRTFDAGFDFEKSFKSRLIAGVVPGSNAHQAGLRDGQRWVTGGIVRGNPTRLTKLTVVENDTQKVVQYYPAAKQTISLPQYLLRRNLSNDEQTQCLSRLGVLSTTALN